MDIVASLAAFRDIAGNGGEGSRIALLDTGIDPSHPNFRNADIVVGDLIDPGGKGEDIDGHGTACAGLILSVAPRCTLLSGRIMDRGGAFTYDCLISALYWAAIRNADVICICSGARHTDLLADKKLGELEQTGCITVAAIGNHGRQGSSAGVYPARSSGCLAVGTATSNGELSSFTNVPEGKDLYCIPGEEFETAALNGSRQLMIGTSASAAVMAGMFGLLVAARRNSNAKWSESLLNASSKRTSSRGDYLLVDPARLLNQAR